MRFGLDASWRGLTGYTIVYLGDIVITVALTPVGIPILRVRSLPELEARMAAALAVEEAERILGLQKD